MLKAILIGIVTAGILMILMTFLFCLLLKMTSGIPYGIIDYVMIGIEGASVLIGAYIACIIIKSKGLIVGAIVSAAVMLVLFCCGFILSENHIGILTLIRCAAILLCGIVGGIAGVNKKEKVRIK